jgi:glycosyltransferase involved in cell wall biosynthesis
MRISVLVTTYNRPDALDIVLEGYLAQTDRKFQLIIADDGSKDETKKVVSAYGRRAQFPVEHVWQVDQGFRAAAIRNRALAATEADYIIFSDGDCIPLPTFVARHRALAEPGWFLTGNRILLSKAFTHRVLKENLPVNTWPAKQWAFASMKKDINRFLHIAGKVL